MPKAPKGRCKQEGCTAGQDGKCLEGFDDLQKCPHFEFFETAPPGVESREEASTQEVSPAEPEAPIMVNLPEGKKLEPDSAKWITMAWPTRLIIVAGAADSGKTTLLAGLYERFNKVPFAGYVFAGSRTLPGFEQRCHLARLASWASKPDTERTKQWIERDLLHLRVRVEDLSRPAQDMLFSDLPGEKFRALRDSVEEAKRMVMLRRADHFVLLIDGEKLADPGRRQGAYSDGTLILQSCSDAGMLGLRSRVDILFTKWDIILSSDQGLNTQEFVKHIETKLKSKFEGRLARLRFAQVAARSEKGDLPPAFGLNELFPSWVEEARIAAFPKLSLPSQPPKREFDRYGLRRLKRLFLSE